MKKMDIETELMFTLNNIESNLRNPTSAEQYATLVLAKSNVLIALQKYEKVNG